ncbi:2,3,4,5-tetrahydropyridine-2,6-dicarboxylate N-succinyltransferase, partial [candidate division KSB1 bacterium]|nr:2,3,4,5-tetrahydropyridine-2,6-dicarboxylate N-succinyltransferase [candidate division KSB1 bacterium]
MNTLKEKIEQIYSRKPEELGKTEFELFEQFKSLLNSGEIRSAEKIDGEWQVNQWVKKGILLGFRLGKLVDCSIDEQFRFFDKSTYPLKKIQIEDKIRQVPGGSSIRDGAYVAPGVVIMPPAYINVGAYVDEETMVDSHALVGSCAQIGKRV